MKKLVLIFTVCFFMVGCEKQVISEGYPEMKAFYTESCALPAVTIDSVRSFSAKYPKIQENIKAASLRITIECDTTWDGETHINF